MRIETAGDSTGDGNNLLSILRRRASERKSDRAYTFLAHGEEENAWLTYGELDQRAMSIGAWLQQKGLSGERAVLLYPPGLEFVTAFFGCLRAGLFAVPSLLPHPKRPASAFSRLATIFADCAPKIVLTTARQQPILERLLRQIEAARGVAWLLTDEVGRESATACLDEPIALDSVAFLQYTSGSTSSPKGVKVSHRNLFHNLSYMAQVSEEDESGVGFSWLPASHDMGLIQGVLLPVFCGFPSYLMSPLAFLQRPLRWLEGISRYRVTISGGPNFAYELCGRKATAGRCSGLDLSSWRTAFNGAEPVFAETVEEFGDRFASCGLKRGALRPVYGLAEGTLLVSCGQRGTEPVFLPVDAEALAQDRIVEATPETATVRRLVACGRLGSGLEVAIVDAASRRCAEDRPGEIWLAGGSVAQGYWNLPQETRESFGARLAGSAAGPFLRTGDCGFLKEGELFITGRIKDLIIIDGRNHFPQDIERLVERCHPSVRSGCCVAFSIPERRQEKLILMAEVMGRRSEVDADAICAVIRRTVSEAFGVRVQRICLLPPRGLAKTTSGKVCRQVCRRQFLDGTVTTVAGSQGPVGNDRKGRSAHG